MESGNVSRTASGMQRKGLTIDDSRKGNHPFLVAIEKEFAESYFQSAKA